MTDTQEKLRQLREQSPAKYALLLSRLRSRAAAAPAGIGRRPASAGAPLSFAQQRLWFLDQLNPGDTAYNMPYALRLEGPVDLEVATAAFRALVHRHETLRTTFRSVNGEPVQVVTPPEDVRWHPERVDLREVQGAEEAEEEVRRLAAAHAATPFDLGDGPLFRVTLVRLADQETVALINLHHIITDDWSMGVLTQEFATLYTALRDGGGDPLPPLEVQYADYAHWQRGLSTESRAAGLAHWRERFRGESPSLGVPTDRARPPVQTYAGRTRSFHLSADVTRGLRALAADNGATLFMSLLAGYSALLHRYSGQDDIIVGTSVAGRGRPETEPLIGFLVNTLALRADLSGDPAFDELLARTKRACLADFAHQDVPFEQVVEEIQPDRDLSRAPLFQTMLTLHNVPRASLDLAGLRISPFAGEGRRTAMYDLSLDVVDEGEQLRCDWECNTDLYTDATIERMAGHFERLLGGAVADPQRRLSALPLLTDAERTDVLTRENTVSVRVGPAECVHPLFEEHARTAPDAIAVVDGEDRVSYRELDRRAGIVAARLRALGVGPEVRVGLCAPRCADSVAAVLGVLKAGGAYVPLDPSNPADRLRFILADASVRLLLTRHDIAESMPGLTDGMSVGWLDDWLAGAGAEDTSDAPAADPAQAPQPVSDNLAFLVYTSGSTGRAKGAMLTHGALMSAYRSWERVYELGTVVRRHLQAANIAFDVFTGDMVRALCSGGTLVLCHRETLLDPARLYELLQRERVDFADLVPVVIRLLSAHVAEQRRLLDNFKVLAVGADIWFMRDYWNLKKLCPPGTRLVNSYGITESTVDSGLFETPMPERSEEEPVPIGRPLPNTEFYVLDDRLQPVPVGVHGTLYIGGLALARGYVGRPALTAERFLPHPFSDRPGARLYNTGDLARLLPTGDVEVLGRVDRQVKIRGFRIELEEVESVLGQHPAVQAAAVVVHTDAKGERRLAGYVELRVGSTADAAELQDHLRTQLPYYMVPSTITLLDRIPLNANGKHERKALPAPAEEPTERPAAVFATATEELVADIWRKVVGAEEVTPEDDFFQVGGHSLLVPRVLFELRRATEVDLPLIALFEATTVAELAQRVDAARTAPAPAGGSGGPGGELTALPELDAEITVAPEARRKRDAEPRVVLLTGATGFLGAHLLDGLLRTTEATVHCLLRAENPEEGARRLIKTLAGYGVPAPADGRVVVEPGDLEKPLLGLGAARFDELTSRLDAIYHSGAWVSFTLPYTTLRAANVDGTQEVLRLAARGGGVPVHHVSTASVPEPGTTPAAPVTGGYNQSKWAAEHLAVAARGRGVPVDVYRPDYVGGHSATGIGNPKDLIWAIIKGSVQLGCYPDLDFPVQLVPVDRVAGALLALASRPGAEPASFDLAHPEPVGLDTVFEWVIAFGYRLRKVSYADWLTALQESAAHSWQNALFPFLELFTTPGQGGPGPGPSGPEAAEPGPARPAYLESGTACPTIDQRLLHTYLAELVRSGYLQAPGPDLDDTPLENA
ncbi:amino acid adenylation domain-containing protein [Streptomyces sp. JJ66]|uniref:non-ribosomal peptide synthetase n=1 Tax=Streptomyces sp. JJ66 TaxID=2803843 RepID=UPI001C57F6D2|nr:non-ribosomal peptide synthetase [Streptomyces sp. JJ66]MBW1600737.1 amino acid adenylation domain-containing protein [Streptomyces sp. JJ66]